MRTKLLLEDASKEYNEKAQGSCSVLISQRTFLNVALLFFYCNHSVFYYDQSQRFSYSPSFRLVWDNTVICFALPSAGGGSRVALVPQLPLEYDDAMDTQLEHDIMLLSLA